jgi:pSer/pThr/pTyr-binding forkhead associated (FHA) protein
MQKLTIGRERNCDIQIADDSVSRVHAEIAVSDDGKLSLRDLASSNGTILIRGGQRRRIQQEFLSATDHVMFGEVVVSVKDLLDTVQSRAQKERPPDKVAPVRPAASVPATQLVRCGCGAVKERFKTCVECGQ